MRTRITALAKTREISARSKRVWQRLEEWYGARLLESYGKDIPHDWSRLVDGTDNETVKRGLSIIRNRYLDHPPTLPQFEQAMRPAAAANHGPSPGDVLCAFVMKTYGSRLTAKQIRETWTYFGTAAGEIAGVIVPADGDSPAVRVTLLDVQSGQQAFVA
jgi:hypothetical protein